MLKVMNKEKINIQQKTLIDPATDERTWRTFIPDDENDVVYQLPDDAVIGVSAKDRRLRKDETQVIFYGISQREQWAIQLMPEQVFALCLFDGRRTLKEASQILAEVGECNYQAANLKLRRFLKWMRFGETDYLEFVPDNASSSAFQSFDFEDYNIAVEKAGYQAHLDNPISLMMMLTDKCQTDCVYCYACRREVAPQDLLSIERIHQIIDEAADLGVTSVNLDGGDMMCRKEIVEIIQHLADCRMEITASTKGYISKQMAGDLYRAGLDYIQIGLDAPAAEIADQLTGSRGFFGRMVETIHNLTEAGITTRSNSIITSQTVDMVPALVDFLMTLPLDNIKICPAFRSYFVDGDDLILSPKQKERLRGYMQEAEKKYSGRAINWECNEDDWDMDTEERSNHFYNRPLCSGARTQCIVTPDGKVVTCEQSPQSDEFVVGDLKVQSLKEVWDSQALKEFCYMPREKFKGTACYTCEDFEPCVHTKGHCYFDALKVYGTMYGPAPKCPKATQPDKRWC